MSQIERPTRCSGAGASILGCAISDLFAFATRYAKPAACNGNPPVESLGIAAKPDILWISPGVPQEPEFVVRNLDRLKGVGVAKTAGG